MDRLFFVQQFVRLLFKGIAYNTTCKPRQKYGSIGLVFKGEITDAYDDNDNPHLLRKQTNDSYI